MKTYLIDKVMNKKVVLGLVAILIIALIGIGIYRQMNFDQKKEVVKIGAIVHLTGESSTLGIPLKNGLLYAEEYINKLYRTSGKQFILIIEDSQNTTKGTINAFQKLLSQKVDAIITTGDIEFRAINDMTELNKIPVIGTSCTGGIENRSSWLFRYCYSEQSQDRDLSYFLINTLNLKKMSLIYPNNTYGLDIKKYTSEYFKEYGGIMVSEIPYEESETNQRPVVIKAIKDNPEVICIRGIGSGFESVIRQLREQGYKGQIVGDVTIGLPETIKNIPTAVENTYFVASELDINSQDTLISEYVSNYRIKFKSEPSFWDAMGFDSFYILAYAIDNTGKDKNAIKETLYNMKPLKCLLGTHGFDEFGDIEFKTSVFKIINSNPTIFIR